MGTSAEQLDRVSAKLVRLIRDYQAMEKEHRKLREELERKTEAEQKLRDHTRVLERQLQLVKAASGETEEGSRKELQKQLSHYIREIDRCIAILGE